MHDDLPPGPSTERMPSVGGFAAVEIDVSGSVPGVVASADRVLSTKQLAWRRFKRHKLAVGSGIVLLLLALAAVFAGQIARFDYHSINLAVAQQGPSSKHLF